MKKLKLLIAISAAVFAQMVVQAQLITGAIGFTGQVTLDSNSPATATAVTSWTHTVANGASGIFTNAPYAITNNTPVAFTSQIWNFNPTASITNLFNLDGFKCELLSSFIVYQGGVPGSNGLVDAEAWGILSGNGFTPTTCLWTFTISDPPADPDIPSWTFQASLVCLSTNGEPVLASTTISNRTVLSWSDPTFGLQSAPTPNGTFTNIPSATSPYTNQITGNQQYFRLFQP